MISIKPSNKISDFEKLYLTDLSYSRIDTYKMCPSKYFFSYIKKEPRQFNDAAVLRKYSTFSARGSCRHRIWIKSRSSTLKIKIIWFYFSDYWSNC